MAILGRKSPPGTRGVKYSKGGDTMPDILQLVKDKDPGQREFHQAVMEVMASIKPVMDRNPEYRAAKILERLVEPERVILFRVPPGWTTRARCRSTGAFASR